MNRLKISARQAGMVENENYCPADFWHYLRLKKFPFEMGMPGIMFYLEALQKQHIHSLLEKHGNLPSYFGPFADCTQPVEYPVAMEQLHQETEVIVTARVDMMLRKKDGNLCLLDLKTSKFDGGGHAFLPQYEVQVIGYSWVTEQANIGTVGTAGLLYCEVQKEDFLADPEHYRTSTGISVPFNFKPYAVDLDYSRLTRCLKEAKAVWESARPPRGAENCKNCKLLTRLVDLTNDTRQKDYAAAIYFPELRYEILAQEYARMALRCSDERFAAFLVDDGPRLEGDTWADWSCS